MKRTKLNTTLTLCTFPIQPTPHYPHFLGTISAERSTGGQGHRVHQQQAKAKQKKKFEKFFF